MTIPRYNYVVCPEFTLLMAHLLIWQKKKKFTVAGNQKYGIRQYIFRTIVSEVSHCGLKVSRSQAKMYKNFANYFFKKS